MFDEIIIVLLSIIGFVSLASAIYLKLLLNSSIKEEVNSAMQEEAKRAIFDNAENNYQEGNYPLQSRVHSKGIALIKGKNGKYNLIPQIKVRDIGLY